MSNPLRKPYVLTSKSGLFSSGPFVLLCLLMLGQNCQGAEVEFNSRSYLFLFEDTADNKHAPFYEYAELTLKNLKERKVSFYSAGWIRYDLKTPDTDGREKDELSYAYLRYAPFEDSSLVFQIGRERVVEGVMAGLIDGISARWEPTRQTGFSLYGGVPVETELDGKKGDLIYGGRLYHRIERKAEVGISFLREDDDGSRFREEFGFDLWLSPFRKAEVFGHSFFNNVTHGWMEQEYNLRIRPIEALTLTGVFSYTDYSNAFSVRTLNAFSPEFVGEGETLTKKGGMIEYRLSRGVTLTADFVNYSYKISGDANRYGASVSGRTSDAQIGACIYRMDGATERLRYTELRLYGKKDIGLATLALDLLDLHYDAPFNGLSDAYSLKGTFEYQIARSLNAGLSADFRKTPDFSHDVRVLAKLVYAIKKR